MEKPLQIKECITRSFKIVGLCIAAAVLFCPVAGIADRSIAVNADLPVGAKPGERPHAIVWSGRKEPVNTQVAFDNLKGWTMTASGDAEVGLCASVERQLWRSQLAKFTYGGGTTDTTVEIMPPAPIDIPERFDAANFWLYGGNTRDVDKPLQINLIVEDASGREYTLKCGPVTATYWNIQHAVFAKDDLSAARFPMKFKKIVISNCKADGPRVAYFESISFYKQNRKPELSKLSRPRKPVYPVSDRGLLPTPPADVKINVKPAGNGAEFISSGQNGTIRFFVRPQEGLLNGVTACWNDGSIFHPMADGRILQDFDGSKPSDYRVTSSTLKSGKLSVKWVCDKTVKPVSLQADYSLKGRTLVVDVKCQGGTATGLSFGKLSGLSNPRGIEVPYLLMGDKPGPWIGCAEKLFVSVLPDWYNSDFSEVSTKIENPTATAIGLMGGTSYRKLTDNTRNDLRDRVLVTVSPEFADTLPNSQNPVSINHDRLADYMLFMSAQWCPEYWKTLKSYGVDKVIANHFGQIYARDWLETAFGQWRPRPDVTVEQLQQYFDSIRSLGYIPGTYMCALLASPVCENWDENKLFMCADGSWADSWYGSYSVDPNRNPEYARAVGEKTKKLFNPGSVFLDVYTCSGIGCTVEAGVEGAGIARQNIFAIGDSIVEARKWYESTFSEGYYRWLYDGLTDMDYATIVTKGTASEHPLLVDFDLLKIHPFEIGTMMGYEPKTFLPNAEGDELSYNDDGLGVGSTSFHKYVSSSLAYGHGLMLGYGYWPPLSRLIQYYAIFQGPQSEYLKDKVSEIRYHNGTDFVTTSQALIDDSYMNGRLKVTYSKGLIVYVNYNATSNWTVSVANRSFELPPYGWLIIKPGEILSYSALVNGNRVDYAQTPDYYYMNTGASTAADGPIDLDGAVYIKRDGSEWRIIPCGDLGKMEGFHPTDPALNLWDYRFVDVPVNKGCKRIVVNAKTLCVNAAEILVKSIDKSGKVLSSEVRQVGDGHIEFTTTADVKEFRISPK